MATPNRKAKKVAQLHVTCGACGALNAVDKDTGEVTTYATPAPGGNPAAENKPPKDPPDNTPDPPDNEGGKPTGGLDDWSSTNW